MENLENINPKQGSNTISSLDLVSLINTIRKEEGIETVLRHDHFLVKIEKELGEDSQLFRSAYKNLQNREMPCYNLPKDEATLMLMSESRGVRKGVLLKLRELENAQPKLPNNFKEALKLLLQKEEESERQQCLIESQYVQIKEQAPKVIAFENVIDSANTYTLDSVSDILNIGRTTLCKMLEEKKWKTIKETHGTSSTRYAEEIGYAKTIYEYVKIGKNEIKTKRFVLKKKGLDKLLIERQSA